jgi:hypothetical protein
MNKTIIFIAFMLALSSALTVSHLRGYGEKQGGGGRGQYGGNN